MKRLSLGGFSFILGDRAGLHHGVKHKIAAFHRALGMMKGIQAAGALDNSGEHSALREVDLVYILAKIILRCFAKPDDGKTADLPKRYLVRVHGEYLLLIEAMLKDHADNGFAHLARIRLL